MEENKEIAFDAPTEEELEDMAELEQATKEFEIRKEIQEMEAKAEQKVEDAKNKKKIWLIVLIAVVVVLLAGAIYYFLFREKNMKLDKYTLEMISTDFTYSGTGVVVTDDVAEYNLSESDTIQFLEGDYPEEGDLVSINGTLFNYREITLGDNIYRGVKPDTPGVVKETTENSVTVRESIKGTVDVPAATYSPSVGVCAIMTIDVNGTDRTVKGEVTQVLFGETYDYVTLSMISPSIDISDGDTGNIKFASEALSSAYECSDLYVTTGGKISDVGNHGEADPDFESNDLEVVETAQSYSSTFPESENPSSEYELVKANGLQVAVGDSVTTSTYLYKWTFVEKILENKVIKSLVRGVVKSVELIKDDAEISDGTFKIEIYDLDKNYLTFDIGSEYEPLISIGMNATISDGNIEITAPVLSIEGLVGSIANSNFKKYDLDYEFTVTITGDGGDVLLLPKKYVKDDMVKKVIGEEIKEVEVTYEEYNDSSYKITGGIVEGDIVESYE